MSLCYTHIHTQSNGGAFYEWTINSFKRDRHFQSDNGDEWGANVVTTIRYV